jgi:hypothetical protein
MPSVVNIKPLQRKLQKLVNKYESDNVVVGFAANYAIFVHEKQAHHVVGQWKYLEQPARELGEEIGQIVINRLQQGDKMPRALILGGMRLQRAAQELTPVDTGNLRGSAFTDYEKNLEQAATKAAEAGGKIQSRVLVKRAKQKNKSTTQKAKQKRQSELSKLKAGIKKRLKSARRKGKKK